ncbi:hypothetical protein J3F83DRAFT_681680 [Trichoderma novae-zelandiae]
MSSGAKSRNEEAAVCRWSCSLTRTMEVRVLRFLLPYLMYSHVLRYRAQQRWRRRFPTCVVLVLCACEPLLRHGVEAVVLLCYASMLQDSRGMPVLVLARFAATGNTTYVAQADKQTLDAVGETRANGCQSRQGQAGKASTANTRGGTATSPDWHRSRYPPEYIRELQVVRVPPTPSPVPVPRRCRIASHPSPARYRYLCLYLTPCRSPHRASLPQVQYLGLWSLGHNRTSQHTNFPLNHTNWPNPSSLIRQ